MKKITRRNYRLILLDPHMNKQTSYFIVEYYLYLT